MCAAPKPPAPVAAPEPVTQSQAESEGTRARQSASRRAGSTGYQATMLTGAGGDTTAAPTAKATLGG